MRGRLAAGLLAVLLVAGTVSTREAAAFGETRSLSLFHTHTKESITVTFKRGGSFDERGLEQLNWFLRDWRSNEPTKMDPRLFDTLWQVYRESGSSQAIHIVSAYRSPGTNAMLRRRSSGVADNSQHMSGKAMDFFLPDVPVDRIRALGMKAQHGGVGFYPSSGQPFVHLDVGSVRAWPRMSRDQLARLFPDGRTVHLPADGKPLAGYEEARAEILSRGGVVSGVQTVADATPTQGRSLLAALFGSDDDEGPAPAPRGRATPAPRPVVTASAAPLGEESATSVLLAYNNPESAVPAAPEPVRRAVARSVAPVQAPETPQRVDVAALAPATEPVAEPRLVWQVGPAGQIAAAPLPPRRPDDIVATATLAYAPATEGAASLPRPPARPAGPPIQVAGLGDVPVPMAAAALSPAREAVDGDRAALRILFSQAASAPASRRVSVAVSAATPYGAILPATLLRVDGPVLAMSFSAAPGSDLATDRFTGPAVKALPVLR